MVNDKQDIVLFAILNWGLGHASRSIPFVQALQQQNYKVVVCSDGSAIRFLESELQDVIIEVLPAYNIHYGSSSMAWNMIQQAPKIYSVYRKEKQVFGKLVDKYQPRFCISDNRYGCRSKIVPSYFLGHQWNILSQNGRIHHLASKLNQFFIQKFEAILIPDDPSINLSGELGKVSGFRHFCTGILSRFSSRTTTCQKYAFRSCTILSGPEPARSILERRLLNILSAIKGEHVVIRGSLTAKLHEVPANVTLIDMANKEILAEKIAQSNIIICRSGYSSLMDYISLGVQNMILIPTSGQTEQQYLAKRMSKLYDVPYLEEADLTQLSTLMHDQKMMSELTLKDHLLEQVIVNLKNPISLSNVSK